MNSEILKLCIENGLLLDKDACEILSELNDSTAREIIGKISRLKEKIITKSFFSKNLATLKEISNNEFLEKLCIKLGLSIEISREIKATKTVTATEEKKEIKQLRNVKVLYSATNQTKKLAVDDFVKYFRSRYNGMKRVLQEAAELDNLVSINKINEQKQNLSVIGIVFDKRVTKNKNILFEIEDLTGKINVLVNQNKPEVYEKAKDIVFDSVIGVKGAGNRDWVYANDLILPDCILHEKLYMDREEAIAFISDVHVGSKMFLEKNFLRFIEWLNGNIGDEGQKTEAKKIKYLLITGDTIDGVGVYPGQENLLEIKDVAKQYEKLAECLSLIRKDVTIILCPGQHDAIRVAEPQPPVGKEYGYALHALDNIILVSNPALIEIINGNKRGLKILMYHGASMTSLINEIESLRMIKAHDTPAKVVKHILKLRHLAPMHSSVTYIPDEKNDELMIKEVPDIIATADLHKPDIDMYNNILIVCSSCWQSLTPFEEKVGNHPDPCKVPVLNLKTRQIKIMDFSEAESGEVKVA